MKNTLKEISKKFNMTIIILINVFMLSCAHHESTSSKIKPVIISPSANSTEELNKQHAMMDKAYSNQVDILSSTHFNEAKAYLLKADSQEVKGAASTDILSTLGYSQAHLLMANKEAIIVGNNTVEIANARNQALKAGARNLPNKLSAIDNKYKKMATHYTKITPIQNENLKNQYLDLELASIKYTKLGYVKNTLALAKDKGAEKITPKAYKEALQNYNISETLIETDRHNNSKIDKAVSTASLSADRVMTLLSSEQNFRNQTPEQRAITLESKDRALKDADSVISENASELSKQGAILATSSDENEVLKRKEHDDKVVADAAAQFSTDEADVYRQEGTLIIRLKSMNFSSGRAELPTESLGILTKVKEVMKDIGPSTVMIEGHTDSIGNAKINKTLSEKRAQSVKEFLANDRILENNSLDSVGLGFTKPLATNKTKEGRAQNRRVDIIIKPNQSI